MNAQSTLILHVLIVQDLAERTEQQQLEAVLCLVLVPSFMLNVALELPRKYPHPLTAHTQKHCHIAAGVWCSVFWVVGMK